MGKTLADIDNHRNAVRKSLFGGSIAAAGKVGSALSQMRAVLPILIAGGIVLLAMLLG